MKLFFASSIVALVTLGTWAAQADANHDHAQGIGAPGDPAKASRVLRIVATDDLKFSPMTFVIEPGETVRIVVANKGTLKHELILGTKQDLESHAAEMLKNPEMEHEEDNALSILPGETREIVWRFTSAGRVDFACLVPGHYEGGMVGHIEVSKK